MRFLKSFSELFFIFYKIYFRNSKKVNFVIPVSRFSYPPQRGLKLKNKKIYMIKKNNYNINSQKFIY